MDFVFKLDTELAMEATTVGGAFGTLDTGVYGITINHAALNKTKNGNNVVDINITTDSGHQTTIYGMCIDTKWASGKENFGYKVWQSLAATANMKTGDTAPFKLELKTGTTRQLIVFKELHGIKLKAAIQKELDIYNGEIKESNSFHSFYFTDGSSLGEKIGKKPAEEMEKVRQRLADRESKAYKEFKAGETSLQQHNGHQEAINIF